MTSLLCSLHSSGAVVASPDTDTPGGSYYYHWERDAALSMQALLKTTNSVDDVKSTFDDYITWVKKVRNIFLLFLVLFVVVSFVLSL